VKNSRPKLLLPIEQFKCCPLCGSTNLETYIDIHAFCAGCRWDSSEAFVESGGMDALIYEYETMLESQKLMNSLEEMNQLTRKREVA